MSLQLAGASCGSKLTAINQLTTAGDDANNATGLSLRFRSAVDIVKIASETIEGLFNMRLALPVALVRALTEGLDEVLRKCVLTCFAI